MLRRIRRASLAVLRKEIEATDQLALGAFLPSWMGVDRHAAAGAGIDRLREMLVPLQGLALPADVWERDVLPRRVGAYSPVWLDQLCASGEVVWVGAGALGRNSGRVALYFREDAAALGAPWVRGGVERPEGEVHDLLRARLERSPCFFTDFLAQLDAAPEDIQEALWDLVWAGEVTNDAFAPLRAPRLTLARAQRGAGGARRSAARRDALRLAPRDRARPRRSRAAGRLTAPLFADGVETRPRGGARSPSCCWSATGSSRASTSWPRACRAGSARCTTRCRRWRRSASAAAATSSRASAARSSRCRARSSACARRPTARPRRRRSCSPRPIPAQPYGAALPWPKRDDPTDSRAKPARAAGAYVVLAGSEPVVYIERGGRGLQVLVERNDPRLVPALEALTTFFKSDRKLKLSLERVDGEPVVGSDLESLLIEVGFRAGPRKLTLSA